MNAIGTKAVSLVLLALASTDANAQCHAGKGATLLREVPADGSLKDAAALRRLKELLKDGEYQGKVPDGTREPFQVSSGDGLIVLQYGFDDLWSFSTPYLDGKEWFFAEEFHSGDEIIFRARGQEVRAFSEQKYGAGPGFQPERRIVEVSLSLVVDARTLRLKRLEGWDAFPEGHVSIQAISIAPGAKFEFSFEL